MLLIGLNLTGLVVILKSEFKVETSVFATGGGFTTFQFYVFMYYTLNNCKNQIKMYENQIFGGKESRGR